MFRCGRHSCKDYKEYKDILAHILENYSLRSFTTFKIGGKARYFTVCESIEALCESLGWCTREGVPWFVLGNGSNILVSDKGFPGLVVKLGKMFKQIKFHEDTVEVGAGVLLPVLSRYFLEHQWGGFEFMCDIPGTIGGAVRMNAGTKEGEIKDQFVLALMLTPNGETLSIDKGGMEFCYRKSSPEHKKNIVLGAQFSFSYFSERHAIREKIKQIVVARRQKQPANRRNCGSVFKSPSGSQSAGWYIDKAGLKGARVGDAMVAFEHANWIVNVGNAKAEDVKGLIEKIQHEVFKQYRIKLEREVIYAPDDLW